MPEHAAMPAGTAANGTPVATRAQAHTHLGDFGKGLISLRKFLTFHPPAGVFRPKKREVGKGLILLRKFLFRCNQAESLGFLLVVKRAEWWRASPHQRTPAHIDAHTRAAGGESAHLNSARCSNAVAKSI
jgi:hypothetical protein